MKNLLDLMKAFGILGMEPDPLDSENGLEMPPEATLEPESEFELDADGNIVLDAEGNPVKKAVADSACACDPKEGDLPAAFPPPAGGLDPSAGVTGGPVAPDLPPQQPEDEFDFNI